MASSSSSSSSSPPFLDDELPPYEAVEHITLNVPNLTLQCRLPSGSLIDVEVNTADRVREFRQRVAQSYGVDASRILLRCGGAYPGSMSDGIMTFLWADESTFPPIVDVLLRQDSGVIVAPSNTDTPCVVLDMPPPESSSPTPPPTPPPPSEAPEAPDSTPLIVGESPDEEGPPEYALLDQQIAQASEEQQGQGQHSMTFFQRFVWLFCGTALLGVFIGAAIVIPIALIVIGVQTRNECEGNQRIPVWMIVMGASQLSYTLLNRIVRKKKETLRRTQDGNVDEALARRYPFLSELHSLVQAFCIIWLVIGAFWVYSCNGKCRHTCSDLAYRFAFGVITATFALFAAICLCFPVCASCFAPSRQEQQQQQP